MAETTNPTEAITTTDVTTTNATPIVPVPTPDDEPMRLVGRTGTVHQLGKGTWRDFQGEPIRYTVVGAGEREGKTVLKLESTGLPKSVVPNCPLKWFRPD